MKKEEFLRALADGLSQLPPEEVARHLAYYEEMLDDISEDEGLDEEAATARLGDPAALARTVLADTPLPVLVRSRIPRKGLSALTVVLLIVGSPLWLSIALALLAVLITVYVTVWVVVLSVAATALAVLLSALAGLLFGLLLLFENLWCGAVTVGCALAAAGLGILLTLATVGVFKGTLWLSRKLVRCVHSIFIRKAKN